MFKRVFYWLLGIILLGFGIALVANTGLGSTAITSIALVLSNVLDMSFGSMTLIQNLIFVFIQILILKSNFPKRQYLQIVVSLLLGVAIDLWGQILPDFSQQNYLVTWLIYFVGCLSIAIATVFQLKADIVYNPAEGVVQAISLSIKQPFSKIKTIVDMLIVLSAVVTSLVAFGSLVGVREGTIISALTIGQMVGWIQKIVGEK